MSVIFLPIGIHMLASCFFKRSKAVNNEAGHKECVSTGYVLFSLVCGGVIMLLLTAVVVVAVDSTMYGKL